MCFCRVWHPLYKNTSCFIRILSIYDTLRNLIVSLASHFAYQLRDDWVVPQFNIQQILCRPSNFIGGQLALIFFIPTCSALRIITGESIYFSCSLHHVRLFSRNVRSLLFFVYRCTQMMRTSLWCVIISIIMYVCFQSMLPVDRTLSDWRERVLDMICFYMTRKSTSCHFLLFLVLRPLDNVF